MRTFEIGWLLALGMMKLVGLAVAARRPPFPGGLSPAPAPRSRTEASAAS